MALDAEGAEVSIRQPDMQRNSAAFKPRPIVIKLIVTQIITDIDLNLHQLSGNIAHIQVACNLK